MLKFQTALLTLLLAAALPAREFNSVDEAKQAAFDAEAKGLWKQIKWQRSVDKALKLAEETKKPLMVFLFVGKFGAQHSPEC